MLFGKGGDNTTLSQGTVHVNGGAGSAALGGNGANGAIFLRSNDGRDRIRLNSEFGNVLVGGNGVDGDVMVFAQGGDNDSPTGAAIRLQGSTGDIILANGDCAEDFDTGSGIEPGTVMVIDSEESLRPSDSSYDTRVAGVVSGAGAYRPALVLDRREVNPERSPIALVGKVYCKVDARHAAIDVGDLLTTSPTRGHAMKASDRARIAGAVIGKALRRIDGGLGLIPILVSLQ